MSPSNQVSPHQSVPCTTTQRQGYRCITGLITNPIPSPPPSLPTLAQLPTEAAVHARGLSPGRGQLSTLPHSGEETQSGVLSPSRTMGPMMRRVLGAPQAVVSEGAVHYWWRTLGCTVQWMKDNFVYFFKVFLIFGKF